MKPIIDSSTFPGLRVTKTVSYHGRLGISIRTIMQDLITDLIRRAVDNPKFFQVLNDKDTITVKANCIILTEEDFMNEVRAAYEKGMEHGRTNFGA